MSANSDYADDIARAWVATERERRMRLAVDFDDPTRRFPPDDRPNLASGGGAVRSGLQRRPLDGVVNRRGPRAQKSCDGIDYQQAKFD